MSASTLIESNAFCQSRATMPTCPSFQANSISMRRRNMKIASPVLRPVRKPNCVFVSRRSAPARCSLFKRMEAKSL
eukprot:5085354-Pyramimonas_sp.AAC.1